MRVTLKKVEKVHTATNNVEEVFPGVGESFNTWGGTDSPANRGKFDPITVTETGGQRLKIDASDDRYLPDVVTNHYFIFYYTLYQKDINYDSDAQFSEELYEFNFLLKVFN